MLTRLSDWYDWPFADARSSTTFDQLRRQMDRLFSDFERDVGDFGISRGAWPNLTLSDEGGALVVRAEVPGMTENDFDITVNATTLTIRGERKDEAPEGYAVHRKERRAVQFARSFELPCKVDPDHVEAAMKHGVLTLTLPKAAEARPKQITVKAS
jgi:HSP20 family protein